MSYYSKTHVATDGRVELHDLLGLTGAEISLTTLPAGAQVPFIHAHKQNEEIYGVLSGHGVMTIDGQDIPLQEGDWLRVDPAARRQLRADADSPITCLCVQAKAGSLEGFTMTDAII